ncbi:methyltransferase domain-containing protein [Niveibacterium umoris]|uniref:SAM-dependent methyltransferase n=1 Tax=Niveibacterium umoris TaxID=1193620 RepID=A0A840BJX2_9RHOO|nr:methyltransferase domain-containing protein [Niveibacterium umoris]MBB4012704.1 SAM-dependent methyltransferase [Niveibacterium umoris]
MAVIDKRGVLARFQAGERLSIELGCGPHKRDAEAVGFDALDFPGVDLVGDVFESLAQLPAHSVSACYSAHFFEHIDDLPHLIDELGRTLAPGAIATIKVPHFANPYFYSDPTHSRFFGLYTMSYFARDALLRRKVPNYGRTPAFELAAVRFGFDSPFPVRGLLKRAIGPIFNLTTWVQEFYEENLCYLFPCYEIEYRLRRL